MHHRRTQGMLFGSLRLIGLRGRLLLIFLIALVPAVSASLYATNHERTRLRQQAVRDVTAMSRLLGSIVEGALESTDQMLALLSLSPAVADGGDGCAAVLDQLLLRAAIQYAAIARAGADGAITCSSPEAHPGAELQPQLQEALRARDFAISKVEAGVISGKAVMVVARAVRREAELAAIMAASVELEHLDTLIRMQGVPEDVALLTLNDAGIVLSRFPEAGGWIGRSADTEPLFLAVTGTPSHASTFEVAGLDGVRRLYAFAPFDAGGSRFYAVVGLNADRLDAVTTEFLMVNAAGLLLALTLAGGAAWFGGEYLLRRPIRAMHQTTSRIACGDLAARTGPTPAPAELGELAVGIDAMAAQIEAREDRLEALSRQLLQVHEAERRGLARELHDEVGQTLTAVKLMLQAERQRTPSRRLDEGIALTDRLLQQIRGMSLDLRPAMLDHLGLPATLKWYVGREAARAGLVAECHINPADVRFDTAFETTIFRITQEALTNIVRHASATRVTVSLTATATAVTVAIHDDGKGFESHAARKRAAEGRSLGLLSMEERAALAGGALQIHSDASGTVVTAVFPRAADVPA